MKIFSERYGYSDQQLIQVTGVNAGLRNSLWNIIYEENFTNSGDYTRYEARVRNFARACYRNFFKLPIDDLTFAKPLAIKEAFKNFFITANWHLLYDFIEYYLSYFHGNNEKIHADINNVLERERSGWRLVDGILIQVVDSTEINLLTETLEDDKFVTVNEHLRKSLLLMNNREKPDYANSIKESISAVESMAQIATGNQKSTLSDALKVMFKEGRLHKALYDGFLKIYGYTSDADGIRHAMSDITDLSLADARFFLLSCTSFINYLKSKM